MDFLPAHLIVKLPLAVCDLLSLGATCSRIYAAVNDIISTRLDIRMPIEFARSELMRSRWDKLTSLQIFLKTTTRIQPTWTIDPIPRRLDALRRLHLKSINLPSDAPAFWTRVFDLAPSLDIVELGIVTYPKRRCITDAHISALLQIGAPRLTTLEIAECGSFILGSIGGIGGSVQRVESDTLRTLHITGMHSPHIVDAPVTSAIIEEIFSGQTGGLKCLGSRSYESLVDLKMILHHVYDIHRLRSFKNLRQLSISLHGNNAAAIVLLAEVSNKLAGMALRDLDIDFHGQYTSHASDEMHEMHDQPRITFHDVFCGLRDLRTLRIRFNTTPAWVTDFVCAIEAPLTHLYLESDDFRFVHGNAWTRQYGLMSGTIDAAQLRSYLAKHPLLRVSTKNIAHS